MEPNDLFDFDLKNIYFNLTHIGLAYVLAFIIGWDREKEERSAGLRTFTLVAIASCGFCLIGRSALHGGTEPSILYGIMLGIGFIGGGAIIKNPDGKSVDGTATAASLWNTAAMGASVAFGLIEIAVILVFLNFVTLRFLGMLKPRGNDSKGNNAREAAGANPPK